MPFYAKYSAASSASAIITANQGTNPWIVSGSGTAGTPAAGVVTVQGNASGTPVPITEPAVSSVVLITNSYGSVNVTTAAYVQLVASTSAIINKLYIFDSSGSTLVIATGAAGFESNKFYIFPGGVPGGSIGLRIAAGSRISIKAVDTDATSGALYVTATS